MENQSILAERIAQRLNALDKTERQVSIAATGNPDTLRFIRTRGTMPAGDKLLEIARALQTSVDWLLGADDRPQYLMIQPDVRIASNDDEVEIQQWDISYGMGGGSYLDLPVTGETHKFSRSWLRQFTHAPSDKIFLANGTGDSMTPTIHDSDVVVIDTTQREVRMADRIYAAAYGQTGIIKRLRPMPDGGVKILSDNPSVSPETAYDGELHVVGRIVAIVRRM